MKRNSRLTHELLLLVAMKVGSTSTLHAASTFHEKKERGKSQCYFWIHSFDPFTFAVDAVKISLCTYLIVHARFGSVPFQGRASMTRARWFDTRCSNGDRIGSWAGDGSCSTEAWDL